MLIGPLNRPKTHSLIIARGGKELPRWMPSHPPDHLLVSIVDLMEHGFTTSLPTALREPEDDLSIVRSAGEQLFFVGVPSHDSHLLVMPFEAIELSVALANVKDLDLLVSAAC